MRLTERHHELRLEELPDFVVLLRGHTLHEQYGVFQVLVELSAGAPELSQFVDLHVALEVQALLRGIHLEHLLLFVEVHEVVVAELVHQEVDGARRSQVDVVNHGLRHLVQAIEHR